MPRAEPRQPAALCPRQAPSVRSLVENVQPCGAAKSCRRGGVSASCPVSHPSLAGREATSQPSFSPGKQRSDVQAGRHAGAEWAGSSSQWQAACRQTGKLCHLRSCRAMPLENMACGQGEAGTETGIRHKDVGSSCRGTHGLLAMAFATCPLWHAHVGPSSQYSHILCCVQEENTNRSGW